MRGRSGRDDAEMGAVDASLVSKSAFSSEICTSRDEDLPEQAIAIAAPRMSLRASLLIALGLSLGLWAAIGAAVVSLVSAVRG